MLKTKKIQIKDLQVGMKIKTLATDSTVTFKTVTDKWNTTVPAEDQVRVEFANGAVVNCSVNHPIMVLGETGIEQKKPQELLPTDRVLTETGTTTVTQVVVGQSNDPAYIDITVEDTHTFFAASSESSPMVLTHNSQGGIRNSSATVFYPIWHFQFDDLIVLKNNQGTEETRVRHLDYGVVLNAMFWRRFKEKKDITFFDPNEVPDLYEAFYKNTEDFEKLYAHYEKSNTVRKKTMSAEEVFKGGVLKERTDTGRVYIVNIDNSIDQGPFDPEVHTVYQSNLCCVTGDTLIDINHCNSTQTITISEFVANWNQGKYADGVSVKSGNMMEVSWQRVTNAMLTKQTSVLQKVKTQSGHLLSCTTDHRVYTTERGWVEAGDLAADDVLVIENSRTQLHSSSVEVLDTPVDVYDITVENTHAFFANGILVHNCEILLPTKPFNSLDDEGDFEIELDDGTVVKLPGQHKVLLKDGSMKKVRELTEDDDIENLLV